MTRETKLGIGVAGTFLTLVGGWAGVKIYRGEAPVQPAENPPVAEAKADPTPPAAAAAETPAPVAIQPAMTTPQNTAGSTETTPTPATPAPIAISTPATDNAAPPPSMPAGNESPPPPSIPVLTPPPNTPAPMNETPAPAAGNTETAKPTPATNTTPAPGNADGAPPIMPAPITTPAVENTNPPAPAPATITPPPAPMQDLPAPGPVPSPVVETKKDVEPAPSAVIITKPADQTTPSVTVSPASGNSPATLGPPGGGLTSRPATETATTRPSSEPRVQSYLEEEYHWQPGDSFAAVSQKYYFSDKYANALQQYNREYPLAAAGMRQNPPQMVPGQVIWVPPVRILERDHASLVADLKRLNDRGAPATTAVRPAETAGASSGFGNPKLYKVHERGETMYEISRRTLNDSGLWYLVHRLNPTLSRDPKLPIPAGTVLRLPPEAKLEAGDMPN